jgi:hypothetical protein
MYFSLHKVQNDKRIATQVPMPKASVAGIKKQGKNWLKIN